MNILTKKAIEKANQRIKEGRKQCASCLKTKKFVEFNNLKRSYDGKHSYCKKCSRKRGLKYYYENREYLIPQGSKRKKVKYNTDNFYKMRVTLSNRITIFFCKKGLSKNKKTKEILGGSYKIIKKYIESKFSKGMSWENHGDWHIDHKIPLCAANNVEELHLLCHYTNLQPLWKKDNLSKNGKYNEEDLKNFLNSLTKDN